tara:strand:- start:17559 stop:17972 length:414 start_codon:yes stop_codon:yes gene_type:complete
MQDLHHSMTSLVGMDLAAITSDTTTVGNIIDRAAKEAVEFVILSGTVTDGSYAPLVEHGDAANLSDAATVPATELLGTAAEATIGAGDDDQAGKKIGYMGGKRYVRLSLVSTGTTTGGTNMGSVVVLGHPAHVGIPV